MDGGSCLSKDTAVNMAEILEHGGCRYKVLDELARTPRRYDNYEELASTRPYSDDRHDNPTNRRVDALEKTLSELVYKIDDMMVSRDAPRRPPPLNSQFPRSQEAFVKTHLERERMEIPLQDGKQDLTDFFVRNPIPKPYMFLEKPSLSCAKKKLEYRQHMTANEYLHAYIAMLCDERARDPSTLLYQLRHLKDVAHDMDIFQWPAVRAWTQGVFDAIERGTYYWGDTQSIQNDRFLAQRSHYAENRSSDPRETKETICLDFNSRSCRHGGAKRDHTEGTTRFIHCCLYCYASSRDRQKCDHGLLDCKRKEKHQMTHSHGPHQFAYPPPPLLPGAYGRPRYTPTAQQAPQVPTQQYAAQQAYQFQPTMAPKNQ